MKNHGTQTSQYADPPFVTLRPDPAKSVRYAYETSAIGVSANALPFIAALQNPNMLAVGIGVTILNIAYQRLFWNKRKAALAQSQTLHKQGAHLLIIERDHDKAEPKTTALRAQFTRINMVDRQPSIFTAGGPCIELTADGKSIDIGHFLTRPELEQAQQKIQHELGI